MPSIYLDPLDHRAGRPSDHGPSGFPEDAEAKPSVTAQRRNSHEFRYGKCGFEAGSKPEADRIRPDVHARPRPPYIAEPHSRFAVDVVRASLLADTVHVSAEAFENGQMFFLVAKQIGGQIGGHRVCH